MSIISKFRTAVSRTLKPLVGWLRRTFIRPRYVMGWDIGIGRDYWVKSRIYGDGTIEIVDHGSCEHKTANIGGEVRAEAARPSPPHGSAGGQS